MPTSDAHHLVDGSGTVMFAQLGVLSNIDGAIAHA